MTQKDKFRVFYAFTSSGTCLKCRETGKQEEMDITFEHNDGRKYMSPFCNKCRARIAPSEKEALYRAGLATVVELEQKKAKNRQTAIEIRELWGEHQALSKELIACALKSNTIAARNEELRWVPSREWPDTPDGQLMRVLAEQTIGLKYRTDELEKKILELLNGRIFRVGSKFLSNYNGRLTYVEELHG